MNRHTPVESVTPRIDSTSRCGQCRTPLVWDEVNGWIRAYYDDELASDLGPDVLAPIGHCCSRPLRLTTPAVAGRETPTPRGGLAAARPEWTAAAPPMPSRCTSTPTSGVR
jgi:hypothetical protein